jgi:hypothetical protein
LLFACPTKYSSTFSRWWFVPSSLRVVLAYPNLAMHSNWPLLYIYTNGDVREIEGRRKPEKKRKRRENSS